MLTFTSIFFGSPTLQMQIALQFQNKLRIKQSKFYYGWNPENDDQTMLLPQETRS